MKENKKNQEELKQQEQNKKADENKAGLKGTKDEHNQDKQKDEDCGEQELKKIKQEIDKKAREAKEYYDRWLRVQADFQNYKKRVEKEKQAIYKYASQDLINKLLPVLDNFELALQSVDDETAQDMDSFSQGIKMILKQLKGILEEEGVKEIKAVGEEFDPNYHEAVEQVEAQNYEPNTIINVVRKGYMYKDKVLRPSLVKVSK